MRKLTYSGRGCAGSILPSAPSQPKPPSGSAAARPNSISRLASARRHGPVPGSLTVFPPAGHRRPAQPAGNLAESYRLDPAAAMSPMSIHLLVTLLAGLNGTHEELAWLLIPALTSVTYEGTLFVCAASTVS